MKAPCPVCKAVVPVTFEKGPHPKPSILAKHGAVPVEEKRDRGNGVIELETVIKPCSGSGAVDVNWKPPKNIQRVGNIVAHFDDGAEVADAS